MVHSDELHQNFLTHSISQITTTLTTNTYKNKLISQGIVKIKIFLR